MNKNNEILQEPSLLKLQKENEMLQKKFVTLSVILTYSLLLLSIYALIIGVMNHVNIHYHQTIITTILALSFFGSFLFIMILHTKQPLTLFGFNLNNWHTNIVEAIVYSIVFCILITLIKWYLTSKFLLLHNIPVFDYGSLAYMGLFGKFKGLVIILLMVVYALFIPLQVFITNGAVQSSILNFVHFKHAKVLSVVIASLFFAAMHVSIDYFFAITMLIPGIFWALLYARQQSLLGVIVSHIMVGIYALYILGYGAFLFVIDRALFH